MTRPEPPSTRAVADLLPHVQWVWAALDAACKRERIDARLIETFRSMERQEWLFASGRDRPGRIVTWAKPGASKHHYRIAFDIAVFVKGKPDWDDLAAYDRIGILGEALGLEWGGRFDKPDRPHFQLTAGLTLDQLKASTPEQINDALVAYYRNHGFDRMVETSLA